ncbi:MULTISPECIES: hypothetical protein [Arthrobacter]|uniref:Uncharacterized protein n=1 Tax=Arthrobacter terricola TaxID=2547396 RepID=A0A4R5KKG6_9MICC|nr:MULTISPECIES: hypothetical protein [Arthrobacter]MBT8161461.1 hypothetical protein [Arthrobacter sp. GN70]TDF95632.1 hypothetical protein E1809_11435 [Arthrobacter terricola]
MSSSSRGPRDYSSGTVKGLFALSGTTCYFPDCPRPVVVFIDDEAFTEAKIAHIYGANEGSARYDPGMTDNERRAFANLMLLCGPHHELVDTRHPDAYPAETLLQWKAEREAEMGIDRNTLAGVTEEGLVDAILKAIASVPPQRTAVVELGLGLASPGGCLSFPVETAKDYLFLDMYKDVGMPVLILTVRNTGALKAYVNNQSVHFNPYGAALFDPNHFPYNPSMPKQLDAGESSQWFYDLFAVIKMVSFCRDMNGVVEDLVAKVGLGSGEEFESDPLPVDYLPGYDPVPSAD